jgi:hypothetical protein
VPVDEDCASNVIWPVKFPLLALVSFNLRVTPVVSVAERITAVTKSAVVVEFLTVMVAVLLEY